MSTKLQSFGDFLALFPEKPRKKAGAGFLVICPVHNDHDPSLWVTPSKNPDFVADWKCHAGCTNEAVLKAMNLTWKDVLLNRQIPDSKGGDSKNGKGCQPVNC